MAETLYLVDGSGYIYRAFYAIVPLSNSKGLPTNALTGFSRMLDKLLKDVEAEYIGVAFDTGDKTFRHERYEEYKANRSECPAELVLQMPYFRSIVSAYGIKVMEQSGVEADDIIATLAKNITNRSVVVVSGDKDLCQLVNDNVLVWDAMRDIRYDAAQVQQKFGVRPDQIVDFLSLTGDTSDNVPGIAGVGPKTAAQLISHFGSVDQMLENIPAIEEIKGLRGAKRVRELVSAGKNNLTLSRELITLKSDLANFVNLTPERDLHWDGYRTDELTALFSELEIKSPLATAKKAAEKKLKLDVGAVAIETPTEKVEAVSVQTSLFEVRESKKLVQVSEENLPALLELLSKSSTFAFDTETTSLDPLSAGLVGISFSVKRGEGYFVPLIGAGALNWEEVKGKFKEVFIDPTKKKIGSNIKFDIAVLRTHGLEVGPPYGDTMLASYVLNPDHRQHGLKDLTRRFLGEEMQTYEELVKGKNSILDLPVGELTKYAADDAECTLALSSILEEKLSSGQKVVYETIELPLVPVLEEIERIGIKVDPEVLAQLSAVFGEDINVLEKELYALAGKEINLNSPKQLSELLFQELKLPTASIKKTTHGFSTDAAALDRLRRHHPFPERLLEYRELFKLKSTYIDSLRELVRADGRVHTSFNQAVAATGRLSSTDPNLQNIPIRNERGRRIRKAFIAESGWKLIAADYSQIELRILAHLSEDKELSAAFKNNEDIHTKTAELIFGSEFKGADDARRSELRRYAKTINFGVIYGMGAFRLADELDISRTQASQFIENYFSKYAGVHEYFLDLEAKALKDGYVETIYGRRRFLRDIDTTGRDTGYAVRSVLNAPIQGSASDIIKIAMINLFIALKNADNTGRIVLQVHDELLVEVKEDSAKEIEQLVVSEMSAAAELSVPLVVDSRIVSSW